MLKEFITLFYNEEFLVALRLLGRTSFIWLPIFLGYIFWNMWVRYVRALHISEQENVMLEIKLPREITKSPAAMELVLISMHQGFGEGSPYEIYWKGSVRPWFSMEIVSIGGEIHFFIRTPKRYKNLVEAHIYSQYPTVEIYEVPDYTARISNNQEKYKFWGMEYKLNKPDPYPIKTYIDYGLDKDPKEEFKIDPLASVLEYMGSIDPQEEMWLQIIVRVHKKEKSKKGSFFEKVDWTHEAEKEIEKIIKEGKFKNNDDDTSTVFNLTKGQQDSVAAIERSISKIPFDVGIRSFYITTGDFKVVNVFTMISILKPFSSNTLNSFGGQNFTGFTNPWEDIKGIRGKRLKRMMFDAYVRRSYFHQPYKRKHFVLNTEELATLFHFPSQTITTPTVDRIGSKKSEPPANLPTN